MYSGIIALVCLLLITLGSGTYIRNKVWASEKDLWLDAMKKAPGYARPYQILASQLKKIGRLDESLRLYRKALTLRDPKPKQSQSLSYNNIGNIYSQKKEYQTAIQHYKKALAVDSGNEKAWYNLIVALINTKQWEAASKYADILIAKWQYLPKYQNLKGFILINQKKPQEALPYFRRALRWAPYDRATLIYLSSALSLSGQHERAEWFLKRANSLYPDDILIVLCRAENKLKAGHINQAGIYLDYLLDKFGEKKLEAFLKKQSKDNFSVPLSYEILIPVIVDKVKRKAEAFADTVLLLKNAN
jgi:Tfp pilus assembly protein PilF